MCTLLTVSLLRGEWVELGRMEMGLENGGETGEGRRRVTKEKTSHLSIHPSRLPVILHWYVPFPPLPLFLTETCESTIGRIYRFSPRHSLLLS